jgi:hypothetical protein
VGENRTVYQKGKLRRKKLKKNMKAVLGLIMGGGQGSDWID